MFYLPTRSCSAPAANFSPELCQTQPFPVFAMAGPTKREWSTFSAAQLLVPRHVRSLWRIKSIALLILGDQAHQQCNVFLCLGSRPLKSCMFGLPLTSKSKGRTPENRSTLRSNLDVKDLPEIWVYTALPVSRTIPTAAVWA